MKEVKFWLFKVKEYIKNLNKQQIGIIFIFVLFGIYFFMQHRLIGLYYDDFGNASLSYGYESDEIVGTSYSFGELMRWAVHTYLNWGGRILYALMLIPLIKNGAELYMFIQAIILIVAFIVMYHIVKKYCTNGNGYIILVSFGLCYGLLQGDILTQGFYWASASVLYVWPMLPFMLLVLYYKNAEEKLRNGFGIRKHDYVILFVLITLVTLSQEQLGGALLVWLVFNLLLKHLRCEKKYFKLDFFSITCTIITYAIMFAAPGNWARLSTNTDYVEKSFVKRILDGFGNVLLLMTNKDLKFFNLLLLLAGIIVLFSIIRKKSNIYGMFGLGLIPFLVVDLSDITKIGIFSEIFRAVSFLIFLLNMLVLLIIYFKERNQIDFIALMLAAVASVFCLVISPAFALRSCIPYVIICMLFVAIVMSNSMKECCGIRFAFIKSVSIVVLGLVCLGNVIIIYRGYEDNYAVNKYNFTTLQEYKETDDEVYLLKYDNDVYRSRMSCDKGFEYVDYWLKEYFAIPQNVRIKWKTVNELVECAKQVSIEITYEDGFYGDEGGYRWADSSASMIINNSSQENSAVYFRTNISTGYEEFSKLTVLCNGSEIYSANINNQSDEHEIEIELIPGDNVIEFVTDGKKIDSGADDRNLYMHFSNTMCELIN